MLMCTSCVDDKLESAASDCQSFLFSMRQPSVHGCEGLACAYVVPLSNSLLEAYMGSRPYVHSLSPMLYPCRTRCCTPTCLMPQTYKHSLSPMCPLPGTHVLIAQIHHETPTCLLLVLSVLIPAVLCELATCALYCHDADH